ncbi:acetyltransferase EpsM [Pedobacter sp. CAN_A7]|uniref:acetyltransferase n=1 Tax=Pedobacter sp. CAN_A7 TaxID=2787722 RepID=UPI0018C91FBB
MHIIGASGHAKVIVDILKLNSLSISGVWDDNKKLTSFLGYTINGDTHTYNHSNRGAVIIAIGNNKIRSQIAARVNGPYGIAVHPKSVVSSTVTLNEGTVVMPNATINADCKIGRHVIINTNASVDHECEIGDFVHISPQAALAGNVSVAEGTQIGIGACVLQGLKIGKWATIGAGTVIIKDVPDYAVVVGNPGRIINSIPYKNEK